MPSLLVLSTGATALQQQGQVRWETPAQLLHAGAHP